MNPKKTNRVRPRIFIENAFTILVWIVWLTYAVLAVKDWHIFVFQFSDFPIFLTAEGVFLAALFLILWIRGRRSLHFQRWREEPRNRTINTAEEECLSLLGWDGEKLEFAKRARSFAVAVDDQESQPVDKRAMTQQIQTSAYKSAHR